MGQINKGTTFVTGQQVTAQNLNNLVDSATLQPSAVTAQTAVTTVADTNLLLTANSTGTSLNKVSLANIVTSLNLAKTNAAQSFTGNLTMSGGADIALTSGSTLSLPAGAIQTLANGSSLSLLSGAILTLGQDPVSGFQAVTKNYADNNFLNKTTGGTVSGPLNVSGAMLCSNDITMIGTGSMLTLSADPISSLQAATKAYVDNATTNIAFTRTPASGTFTQGSLSIGQLIIKFGISPDDGQTSRMVTFANPFPNEILTVYISGMYNNRISTEAVGRNPDPTVSSFKIEVQYGHPVYWLAIGT